MLLIHEYMDVTQNSASNFKRWDKIESQVVKLLI